MFPFPSHVCRRHLHTGNVHALTQWQSLDDTITSLTLTQQLWACLAHWRRFKAAFLTHTLHSLSNLATQRTLSHTVATFASIAKAALKPNAMPDHCAAAILGKEVAELRTSLPVIAALSSNHLYPWHWTLLAHELRYGPRLYVFLCCLYPGSSANLGCLQGANDCCRVRRRQRRRGVH